MAEQIDPPPAAGDTSVPATVEVTFAEFCAGRLLPSALVNFMAAQHGLSPSDKGTAEHFGALLDATLTARL